MYGFQVGDKVTTQDEHDATRPWQNLGQGVVCGLGWKPGMLDVIFSNEERFPIRAKILKKVCVDKSSEEEKTFGELRDFVIGETVEILDHHSVLGGWVGLGGGRGVVLAAGKTPEEILVRFDGLGERTVRSDRLCKVRCKRNNHVDAGGIKPQKKLEKRIPSEKFKANLQRLRDEEQAMPKVSAERTCEVELDSFVRAKTDPWRELGIGIIRGLGDKADTVWVQFDVSADQWLLNLKDLQSVPDPGKAKFGNFKRTAFHA